MVGHGTKMGLNRTFGYFDNHSRDCCRLRKTVADCSLAITVESAKIVFALL